MKKLNVIVLEVLQHINVGLKQYYSYVFTYSSACTQVLNAHIAKKILLIVIHITGLYTCMYLYSCICFVYIYENQ